MGVSIGRFAGIVVATCTLAACSPGVDYENGTYLFTEPGTDYVGPATVLVRDGIVTDVWISENDRATEAYGYTPRTPREQLEYAEDSRTEWEDGDLTVCTMPGAVDENCSTYEALTTDVDDRLRTASGWKGLEDGTYRFDTRSVTWENPSWSIAVVEDGIVAKHLSGDAGGALNPPAWKSAEHDWVRYWVEGGTEPFAACQDNLPTYDDEWCVVWSPTS